MKKINKLCWKSNWAFDVSGLCRVNMVWLLLTRVNYKLYIFWIGLNFNCLICFLIRIEIDTRECVLERWRKDCTHYMEMNLSFRNYLACVSIIIGYSGFTRHNAFAEEQVAKLYNFSVWKVWKVISSGIKSQELMTTSRTKNCPNLRSVQQL